MIRVLVERRVLEGRVPDYEESARSVPVGVMERDGFLSGEALKDPVDPLRYFTLSTWKDLHGWLHWADSPDRRAFMKQLEPSLAAPERITVMQHVA